MREPRPLRSLTGYRLSARDGEIGRLEEVYFDDRRWRVRYFVVRTGNWLLGRRVLILPGKVTGVDDEAKALMVDLTLERIRNSPPVTTELPVSRHYEREYFRYYEYQPYWIGDPLFGDAPYVPPPAEETSRAPAEPENPHLRSSNEVRNYRLRASDGDIGHVDDLILQTPGWSVRYLEVDTRNLLPGRHVLVSPAWIAHVDWAGREVAVDLPREAIRTAPPYDQDAAISREYEVALYAHYGRHPDEAEDGARHGGQP